MKEIKFRGKILNGDRKGEWVHGYYFENFIGQHCIVTTCDDKDIDVVDWITKHIYKVDPTTVGQYIGIKDKNGTEIYSGMFCKWQNGGGVVTMSHNCMWCFKDGSFHTPFWKLIDYKWKFEVTESDTPDLLTQ